MASYDVASTILEALGTGPKPPEAIAVATQLSAAYEAAAPARAALATAFNAVGPGKNCSKKNYAAAGGL
jgi:hypothetical protein